MSALLYSTHNWVIKNFTTQPFPLIKEFPELPLTTADPPVKLRLELFTTNQSIRVFIRCTMSCFNLGIDYMACCKLSVVGNNLKKEKYHILGHEKHFVSSSALEVEKLSLLSKMKLSRLFSSFLVGGTLTLKCQLFYKEMAMRPNISVQLGEQSDGKHFKALLTSGEFSDVTVIVGGKPFALHKAILARSPVLKRMIQSEFIEAKEGRVEIEDVEVEVFEEFIRYLYTGVVSDMVKHNAELLSVADKYQVESLKRFCGKWLASMLSIQSAVDFLLLAEEYNEPGLKDKCLTFISKNLKAVRATDKWKELVSAAQRIDLLEEVLAKMDL